MGNVYVHNGFSRILLLGSAIANRTAHIYHRSTSISSGSKCAAYKFRVKCYYSTSGTFPNIQLRNYPSTAF